MPKNILFSFIKVEKHTILAGQGGASAPLALPADAHTCRILRKISNQKTFPENEKTSGYSHK